MSRMKMTYPFFFTTKDEDDISLEEIDKKLKGQISRNLFEKQSMNYKKSNPTTSKEIKDALCMIKLEETCEPDIKYLDKFWTSQENSIKK